MNVYDGARMTELLEAEGMDAAADGGEADLVVLNTCHIRERAAEKVYSDIGRLKREDGSRPMIAVAGCVAQAEGAEIPRRAPSVDIVVGPQAYHRLPQMVAEAEAGRRRDRHRHAGRKASSARCPRGAGRGRAPSSPSRKAATNSAPIASSPIRAAPRSRAAGARSSTRPGR